MAQTRKITIVTVLLMVQLRVLGMSTNVLFFASQYFLCVEEHIMEHIMEHPIFGWG